MALVEASHPIDMITLVEELDRHRDLQAIGDVGYVASLLDGVPDRPSIEHYVKIVRDKALLRGLIHAANTAISRACDQSDPAEDVLRDTEEALFQLSDRRVVRGFLGVSQIIQNSFGSIDALFDRGQRVTGLATHYADLDEMTSGLQQSELVIIAARPSLGKAQPLDAPIKTPTGWLPMGDMRLGQSLASHDGQESQVTGIYPQGRKQVYRVTFFDGRFTECCGEHLWEVTYRDWREPRVLTTEKVAEMLGRKRYRNRLWIPLVSGEFGCATCSMPIDPWFMGYLLGNGNFTQGSLRVSVPDECTVQRIEALVVPHGYHMSYFGGIDYRISRIDGSERTKGHQGLTPNRYLQILANLGLKGHLCDSKFIPDVYMNADRRTRTELLQGLVDSDGGISGNSLEFSTTSPRLIQDVQSLAWSLGAVCRIGKGKLPTFTYKGEKKAGKKAYRLVIRHGDVQRFASLQRKKPIQCGREARLTFTKIEPVGERECQCITASHHGGLYVTKDYIVTHNTALAMNIAQNAAVQDKKVVAVFSLEMSQEALLLRLICAQARVDAHKLRTGSLWTEDVAKVTRAVTELAEAPIFIDDTPGLTLVEMRAKARRLKQSQQALDLIIVDYLQLMSGSKTESRNQEVSAISRGLKGLAKELKVPVIAVSQLNRSPENRSGDRRPRLSDLRESGSIEQDADLVAFIYREEIYKPDEPELQGRAEIIIAKQRNGPTGTVNMAFLKNCTRFEDMLHDHGSEAVA